MKLINLGVFTVVRDKRTGSVAASPYPSLECVEKEGILHGGLYEIITGSKSQMVAEIRSNLDMNSSNPNLKKLQGKKLDVAIVVYTQKLSYKKQDVDNIAKVVLDALKKPKVEDGYPYFFEDDNQIIRLLIYKRERYEDAKNNTCQVAISIREHDPKKEMVLVLGGCIVDQKVAYNVPFSKYDSKRMSQLF